MDGNKHTFLGVTKRYWASFVKEGPGKHIELGLAAAISFFALGQWITSCHNNEATGEQTSQLIAAARISAYAADENAQASRNFAESAKSINEGIDRAVAKLSLQDQETAGLVRQAIAQSEASNNTAAAAKRGADISERSLHVSERAYVAVEGARSAYNERTVYLSLRNSGHIPSGKITVTLHSAFYQIPGSHGVFALEANATRRWKKLSNPPLVPNGFNSMFVPFPDLREELLAAGDQALLLAGVLEYGDGFAEDGMQTDTFCLQSLGSSVSKQVYLSPCDVDVVLPVLKNLDGYPNGEDKY